jgi:hypothetical protein
MDPGGMAFALTATAHVCILMSVRNSEEKPEEPRADEPPMNSIEDGWWNPISPSGEQKKPSSAGDIMQKVYEKAKGDPENWSDKW